MPKTEISLNWFPRGLCLPVIAMSPRLKKMKRDSHLARLVITWGNPGKKKSQSPWLEPNRWLILGVREGDEVIRVSKKKVKELEKNF